MKSYLGIPLLILLTNSLFASSEKLSEDLLTGDPNATVDVIVGTSPTRMKLFMKAMKNVQHRSRIGNPSRNASSTPAMRRSHPPTEPTRTGVIISRVPALLP